MSDLLQGTTPGPWMRDYISVTATAGEPRKCIAIAHPDTSLNAGASMARMRANASLMAAAPTLATENAALRSLCAELVGALEPFARIGGYMRHTPESRSASVVYNAVEADGLNSRGTAAATVGDFRTALTALARSKELLP